MSKVCIMTKLELPADTDKRSVWGSCYKEAELYLTFKSFTEHKKT